MSGRKKVKLDKDPLPDKTTDQHDYTRLKPQEIEKARAEAEQEQKGIDPSE
jgi:hypothetical protein